MKLNITGVRKRGRYDDMFWWILLIVYLIGFSVFLIAGLYAVATGGGPSIFELIIIPLFWWYFAIRILLNRR